MTNSLQEEKENAYARIEEKYSCNHELCELRRRIIKGGAESYVRQCIQCGKTSQPVKKTAALVELNGDTAPEYDNDLESKWNNHKSKEYDKVRKEYRKKRVDDYGDYLSSKAWKEKRQKVMKRANWICEGCGENPASEIHHISYEHVKNEFLFELVAVCSDCHDRIHEAQN